MLGATCVDTLIVPVTFYIVEKMGLRWQKKHPAPQPEGGKT
jgi:hypothetical protein